MFFYYYYAFFYFRHFEHLHLSTISLLQVTSCLHLSLQYQKHLDLWRTKEIQFKEHSRGKTFSLLLLFTECCTTVVCKLCITYPKYDRCHTISCMQVIIHLALEKKTIGVLKTSATCQIRKKQLTNDKCMTETKWFQLFSELDKISHGANMVGQNVPRSRTHV